MSRTSRVAFVFLLAGASLTRAFGDSWMAPQPSVFASNSGNYWVRTTLADNQSAIATLYTHDRRAVLDNPDAGRELSEKVIWSQDLGYTPARLLVSNRGWVVGINRYARPGHNHTLVIWDTEGKRVADYRLEDLLSHKEIDSFVMQTVSSRDWSSNAHFKFDRVGCVAPHDRLVIELEWGKVIAVDLRTGDLNFTDPASPLPESMSGFSDEGVFSFYREGRRIGRVSCTWKEDGSFLAEGTAFNGDSKHPYRLEITPDSVGRWQRVSLDIGGYETGIVRTGALVRLSNATTRRGHVSTGSAEKKELPPETSPQCARLLKPRSVIHHWDHAPALRSQMIRFYDRTRGGEQSFVLIAPDLHAYDGTLKHLDTQVRKINGRERKFDRYLSYTSTIWSDRSGKVFMITRSDHHTTCVRVGYESLLATE